MLADGVAQRLPAPYTRSQNPLEDQGYDWWWHSLMAKNRATGEMQPFFIEYYVINPALGGNTPILGQTPANQAAGTKPSYAMIKVGTWKEGGGVEINNFYPISQFSASIDVMNVHIGANYANETALAGSAAVSAADAANHPEYMSDAGTMSWNLTAKKTVSYSLGYAAGDFSTANNVMQMAWHVNGMRTEYTGTVTFNGQIYDVTPATSYGYQDKNWGNDYTNPWIWLNCNNLRKKLCWT